MTCRRISLKDLFMQLHFDPAHIRCISLIGMAAAGKSTIGTALARDTGWAQVDTDRYLESWWGMDLQQLRDTLGLKKFLQAESEAVQSLSLDRCIISTGGSVIYREQAMAGLHALGPVIHLHAEPATIRSRLTNAATRGLAIADGQTIDDLYNERLPLYLSHADLTVSTDAMSAEECAKRIREWLEDMAQTFFE